MRVVLMQSQLEGYWIKLIKQFLIPKPGSTRAIDSESQMKEGLERSREIVHIYVTHLRNKRIVDPMCLLGALIIFERISMIPRLSLSARDLVSFEAFLKNCIAGSLMLANKNLEDWGYSNRFWASYFKIDLMKINSVEREIMMRFIENQYPIGLKATDIASIVPKLKAIPPFVQEQPIIDIEIEDCYFPTPEEVPCLLASLDDRTPPPISTPTSSNTGATSATPTSFVREERTIFPSIGSAGLFSAPNLNKCIRTREMDKLLLLR